MAAVKRGARLTRALRIEATAEAIADDILKLWWTGPYDSAKHFVLSNIVREHLGRPTVVIGGTVYKVVKLEGGRS